MTWVAAAVIGSAAIGAYASSEASKGQAKSAEKAAGASSAAAKYQSDIQKQIYEQTRADQEPWRQTGAGALNQLSTLMGVTPSAGGYGAYGEETPTVYSPNDLLVGPTFEPNRELYAKDPEYRKIYNEFADNIAYVTANGTLSDAERYQKYGPSLAKKIQARIDLDALNQRMGALAEQDRASALAGQGRASTPGGAKSEDFGRLARDFSMADFEADPGYAFRQQQGQQQIDRQAAARGGLISGAALKATQRFGQDLASQEYGNAFNRFQSNQANQFNRLASLAGVGQTANNALMQAGSGYANAMTGISQANAANQGNAMLAAGQARASGYAGIGNALSGAFANWPQQQQQQQPSVPTGYNLGAGALGNQYAMSQGYQPLDYGTYNSMGGYYD